MTKKSLNFVYSNIHFLVKQCLKFLLGSFYKYACILLNVALTFTNSCKHAETRSVGCNIQIKTPSNIGNT